MGEYFKRYKKTMSNALRILKLILNIFKPWLFSLCTFSLSIYAAYVAKLYLGENGVVLTILCIALYIFLMNAIYENDSDKDSWY